MVETSSSISRPMTIAAERPSLLLGAVKDFVIRRRILLTAIGFAALIGEDVWTGVKPRDPFNVYDPWSVAGGLLVIAGVALRTWSVGILRKDRELTTTGPYRLIRNPLYVGSFLMMFGFCTLINDAENIWFVLGPMLLLYVVKVRQEERLLSGLFPTEWIEYARRTPRFLPRLMRANLKADWRIAQWMRSREYQALLAAMAAMAAIKVWQMTAH